MRNAFQFGFLSVRLPKSGAFTLLCNTRGGSVCVLFVGVGRGWGWRGGRQQQQHTGAHVRPPWDDAEMSIHPVQLRAEQILIWTGLAALRGHLAGHERIAVMSCCRDEERFHFGGKKNPISVFISIFSWLITGEHHRTRGSTRRVFEIDGKNTGLRACCHAGES